MTPSVGRRAYATARNGMHDSGNNIVSSLNILDVELLRLANGEG